jgi:hypothetical protein
MEMQMEKKWVISAVFGSALGSVIAAGLGILIFGPPQSPTQYFAPFVGSGIGSFVTSLLVRRANYQKR